MKQLIVSIKNDFLRGFQFSGCTSRLEFWMYFLVIIFFYLIFVILTEQLSEQYQEPLVDLVGNIPLGLFLIFSIYLIISLYAAMSRRLHDANHSAAWIFIKFIPYIGIIILFYLLSKKSVNENNQYIKEQPFKSIITSWILGEPCPKCGERALKSILIDEVYMGQEDASFWMPRQVDRGDRREIKWERHQKTRPISRKTYEVNCNACGNSYTYSEKS